MTLAAGAVEGSGARRVPLLDVLTCQAFAAGYYDVTCGRDSDADERVGRQRDHYLAGRGVASRLRAERGRCPRLWVCDDDGQCVINPVVIAAAGRVML